MFRMIRAILSEARQASFPVAGPPEEGAARLRPLALSPWHLSLRERVAGRVSTERVVLSRRRPFYHNSLAPVFYGRFEVVDGRTLLRGVFRLPVFSVVFAWSWFAFTLGVFPMTIAAFLLRAVLFEEVSWVISVVAWLVFFAAALALALVGYGMMKFSKYIARDDVSLISRAIQSGLGRSVP